MSTTLAAPRPKVFTAITDPACLQQCITGCEKIVQTSEDNYEAQLKIGVAGLQGKYTGRIQLKEKHPLEAFTLIVDGKGASGFVKATARIQLADRGDQTELQCETDAQVGGLIAAIGSRLIEVAARKMMEEFFKKFGEQLQKY